MTSRKEINCLRFFCGEKRRCEEASIVSIYIGRKLLRDKKTKKAFVKRLDKVFFVLTRVYCHFANEFTSTLLIGVFLRVFRV